MLDKDDILGALQAHQAELQRGGFSHVALFGSIARGEARSDSDIDLLVELDRSRPLGLEFFSTVERVEQILGRKVDVVTVPIKKARLAKAIEQDRLNAF
jgi:predicted nucleotidyltransferase